MPALDGKRSPCTLAPTGPAVTSKTIMAVPLIAHGQVIGVLELINKRNQLSFNESDQRILEGFANQAAVAVQNASLYSKTDQALEARLEELYIMQQIDRDLNASQDIDLALQKMLEAALTHTSARFGTIGLIDHDTNTYKNIWQIQPSNDLPNSLEDIELSSVDWFSAEIAKERTLQNSKLTNSLDLPAAAQWHTWLFSNLDDDQAFLLMLHSEAPDQLKNHDKSFLSRLKDHGIIALKNALLYEELNEVIHEKNEFISFISHELKNPLTVIKGYADILRKGMAGEVTEEQIDYLSTINHNAKRMNTIIKDLSDQSHIETKSLSLDFESTPVGEVINEVLQSYAAQIEKKSLQVTLNIPVNIPNVWCDRLRLIQILSNLVSNAVKYTPEHGEIAIGAEHAANVWDNKGAAEVVHFWVEDNGYGIKPEDQQHLFEKFYRGTDARVKKLPGTGLGLRIAKSLVEMMGGQMWFTSELDEGSTFHLTLPI
jgi:signal transduction histidine kinase